MGKTKKMNKSNKVNKNSLKDILKRNSIWILMIAVVVLAVIISKQNINIPVVSAIP